MPGGRGRRVLHVRYLVSGRPRTRWYRCTSYSVPHMRDRISVYGRKVDVFATSFMYELNAYQVLSPLVTNGTHFNEYTNNTPTKACFTRQCDSVRPQTFSRIPRPLPTVRHSLPIKTIQPHTHENRAGITFLMMIRSWKPLGAAQVQRHHEE